MSSPKVHIIILNYNGWENTIECLESVLRNDYPNYQVTVVDNNSPNNSIKYIKAWAEGKLDVWVKPNHPLRNLSFPPVKKPIPYVFYTREEAERGGSPELEKKVEQKLPEGITTKYPLVFIQTGENLGFAGGNNVGIRYALAKDDFEYIWLLNNDTVAEKYALSILINRVSDKKRVGVIGSKILKYNFPNTIDAIGGGKLYPFLGRSRHIGVNEKDDGQWDKEVIPDYITGASFFIKKEVIEDVGLMDESYFLYWEETDWCERIKRKGWKLDYEYRSKLWHKRGVSTGFGSPLSDYYATKNKLIFFKKFYKLYFPFVYIINLGVGLFKRLKKRKIKNIIAFINAYIKVSIPNVSGKMSP